MPTFKSTYNILFKPDEDEVYDANWFDKDFLTLPETSEWSYDREMQIEDVDIWEVIIQNGGGWGVYASWKPYAEFYLITVGSDLRRSISKTLNGKNFNYNDIFWETYYGPDARYQVKKRSSELGLHIQDNKIWVDEKDMWKYTSVQNKKIIIP